MKLIVAAFTLLSLLGCAGPDILVIRDQYWKAVGFDSKTEEKILERTKKLGKSIGYVDLDYPANTADILTVISHEDPQVVLLSPLFSQFAEQVAEQQKQHRFVAFGLGAGGTVTHENLTAIALTRIDAYRRAGALCRQYLEYPGNDGMRVAALFYSGGAERAAEREAFEESIGEEYSGRVSIQAFPRLNEIREVNDYLSGLAGQAIGIFVVSMSGLNRDAISSIVARYQSLIITERLTGTGRVLPYQDRVLASIDEDWTGVFSLDLSNAGPEIVIEASLAPGPAIISASASWAQNFFHGEESR